MTAWDYGLKDEDVTLENIREDAQATGCIDHNGLFDEDRTDWPRSLAALVEHVGKDSGSGSRDAVIGRIIRTAVQINEKFGSDDDGDIVPMGCALEVAMVWELG